MIEATNTYLKLPKTYISRIHLHWLEIDIDKTEFHIYHWQSIETIANQTFLEHMLTKRSKKSNPLGVQKQLLVEL